MINKSWMVKICILCNLFILSACGFHLRGYYNVPNWLNHIAIIVEQGNQDFKPLLKKQLNSYNIEVDPNPNTANYLLTIERDQFEQNIVSISSSTSSRQYQLIYKAYFNLSSSSGKVLIPSHQVMVSRQITINIDRILGSTQEEERFKSEMIREASLKIINQISRLR